MATRVDRSGPASGPVVTGFSGTGFRVDGELFAGGVKLTPTEAFAWMAGAIDRLGTNDLEDLLALTPAPEFLLIGTGATLARPPRALVEALGARGVGVEAMDSRAAARAWAVLRAEDRWIAAALMPL